LVANNYDSKEDQEFTQYLELRLGVEDLKMFKKVTRDEIHKHTEKLPRSKGDQLVNFKTDVTLLTELKIRQ